MAVRVPVDVISGIIPSLGGVAARGMAWPRGTRAALVAEAGGVLLAEGEGWLHACFARAGFAAGLAAIQARLDAEVFPVLVDPTVLDALRAAMPAPVPQAASVSEDPANPAGSPRPARVGWPHRWPVAGTAESLALGLVETACRLGASDLYLAPRGDHLAIAARLNGVVRALPPLRGPSRRAVLDALRARAGLTPLQSGRAAEGRLAARVDAVTVDVRVQSLPSVGGDALACRLLDPRRLEAARLGAGLPEAVARAGAAFLDGPGGLFLLVGPTDSGKTTTLHRLLATRDARRERIVTLENPVEYRLEDALQLPVERDPDSRRGSAETLLGCLRTTPDILVLGEIRSAEEAAVAVEAGLTGHRVMATLHAAEPATALARLDALGVPRPLREASLRAVVAQRLLPRPCARCARPVPVPADLREAFAREGLACPPALAEAPGCDACGAMPVGRTLVHAVVPGPAPTFAPAVLAALATGRVSIPVARAALAPSPGSPASSPDR